MGIGNLVGPPSAQCLVQDHAQRVGRLPDFEMAHPEVFARQLARVMEWRRTPTP